MSVENLYELACTALLKSGRFTDAFYYNGSTPVIGDYRISTYYAQFQPGWRSDGPIRTQMAAFLESGRVMLAVSYSRGPSDFLIVHPRDLKTSGTYGEMEFRKQLLRLTSNPKPSIPVAFSMDPPALIGNYDPRVLALCASLR